MSTTRGRPRPLVKIGSFRNGGPLRSGHTLFVNHPWESFASSLPRKDRDPTHSKISSTVNRPETPYSPFPKPSVVLVSSVSGDHPQTSLVNVSQINPPFLDLYHPPFSTHRLPSNPSRNRSTTTRTRGRKGRRRNVQGEKGRTPRKVVERGTEDPRVGSGEENDETLTFVKTGRSDTP